MRLPHGSRETDSKIICSLLVLDGELLASKHSCVVDGSKKYCLNWGSAPLSVNSQIVKPYVLLLLQLIGYTVIV